LWKAYLLQKQMPKVKTQTITTERQNWGRSYTTLPQLDLLASQKESYQWFKDVAIGELLKEISPINDFTEKSWSLDLHEYRFGKVSVTPTQALIKGVTYDVPLYVKATLTNKKTGKSQTQEVFLGDIPQMTERGTFIVNGIERAVVSQLVRSPGVFFTSTPDPITGKMLYSAEIRPIHGSWLEFSTTRHDTVTVKIDRRRKFLASTFLRAIGISSSEAIKEKFNDIAAGLEGKLATDVNAFIENTIAKDETQNETEANIEIFRRMHPGEPIVLEKIRENFLGLFFNNRRYDLGTVGRYKINKKLAKTPGFGPSEENVLSVEDIIGTISYLIRLTQGIGTVDDIDSLANRRVRRAGELVATTAFRIGILRLERSVKERMSLIQPDQPVSIGGLINARPVMASINEFFRTSQLSTILDQTNPLSEIDNLNRLTVMGTGGISRERAAFSIRDINSSQYSRIDPIRSPEIPPVPITVKRFKLSISESGFV
jgi:DNA-directed RNA polymerase subunit beta